jgi:hypothetical protein
MTFVGISEEHDILRNLTYAFGTRLTPKNSKSEITLYFWCYIKLYFRYSPVTMV